MHLTRMYLILAMHPTLALSPHLHDTLLDQYNRELYRIHKHIYDQHRNLIAVLATLRNKSWTHTHTMDRLYGYRHKRQHSHVSQRRRRRLARQTTHTNKHRSL